jgi:hypothetical protein
VTVTSLEGRVVKSGKGINHMPITPQDFVSKWKLEYLPMSGRVTCPMKRFRKTAGIEFGEEQNQITPIC